jgi:hypothetical protein
MFGFGKRQEQPAGPRVSTKLCTDSFNGKYPHVGLYDTRERKIWVCKPLSGQAIRTSHARLITGSDNATSTVWKDRFLCFWFYTPDTGEGLIHGIRRAAASESGHARIVIAVNDEEIHALETVPIADQGAENALRAALRRALDSLAERVVVMKPPAVP